MSSKSHPATRQGKDAIPADTPITRGAGRTDPHSHTGGRIPPRGRGRRPWSWLLVLGFVGLLGYGTWAYTRLPGGAGSTQTPRGLGGLSASYGAPGTGAAHPLPISAALAFANKGSTAPVTIQGRVIDQGPTMGCWVRLRDGSATVLAQTWPMVYMPQTLRGATVRVTGALVYGAAAMDATGKSWILYAPGVQVLAA